MTPFLAARRGAGNSLPSTYRSLGEGGESSWRSRQLRGEATAEALPAALVVGDEIDEADHEHNDDRLDHQGVRLGNTGVAAPGEQGRGDRDAQDAAGLPEHAAQAGDLRHHV